ncbi:MAG: hypothetical protein P0116_06820 [Candidatus Nitrosocosmicus sp.]|nr:hypothetical protein [Candidatus Nitrosocosmicus sp.]
MDNISEELSKVCLNGIDLYFDNVGGKHLEAAINNMNTLEELLCGTTSQYNDDLKISSGNLDQQINKSPSLDHLIFSWLSHIGLNFKVLFGAIILIF